MVATFLTRTPPLRSVAPTIPLREKLLHDLERVETYPTFSDTAIRVASVVAGTDASLAEVAGLIRRDGVLAAAVLRAANTWMVRGKNAIEDIQQAVLRLGLQECGRLICAVGMRGMYATHPPAVQQRCDTLLRHALFVARLASGATRFAKHIPAGVAFTAGLLHDIGRVVIAVKCPESADDADPLDYRENLQSLWRERDWFGIDHCAIGYQFAMRNSLPEGVVRATLNHHRPDEEQLQRELVALVAVTDSVANHAQREHNITECNLRACPFFESLSRDWSPDQRVAFARAIPKLVVQSIRDTRAMLKSLA